MRQQRGMRPLTEGEESFIRTLYALTEERAQEEGWALWIRTLCVKYINSITMGDCSVPRNMAAYHQVVVQNIFRRLCEEHPSMDQRFPGQFTPWF